MRLGMAITLMVWGPGAAWSQQSATPAATTMPASSPADALAPLQAPGPITFVQGGLLAAVAVRPPHRAGLAVVLRAFNRQWTQPAAVRDGKALVAIPLLRVPTIFTIAPHDDAKADLGSVVAYPQAKLDWDGNVVLLSAGEPAWFGQWAAAIGLAVEPRQVQDLPAATDGPSTEGKSYLLIVGRAAAGNCPADLIKLSEAKNINVLALEASWFGPPAPRPAQVVPTDMHAELGYLNNERWACPLQFATADGPVDAVLNRTAWIGDGNALFAEEVWQPGPGETLVASVTTRVVLSYLHWQQALGRNENADAALLALLGAAARPVGRPGEPGGPPRWRAMEVVYPPLSDEMGKQRPILAAAAGCGGLPQDPNGPGILRILDVRGKPPTLPRVVDALVRLKGQVDEGHPLVILGDDAILDQCEWLKVDRDKMQAGAAGVVWVSDDAMPSAAAASVKLMMTLTQLGVPLTDANLCKEKHDDPQRNFVKP